MAQLTYSYPILSSVSKLFERVILHKIHTHLEDINILPDEQDDFRQYRSTTHQLVKIVEHIMRKLGQKLSTGMILLEVEKAFNNSLLMTPRQKQYYSHIQQSSNVISIPNLRSTGHT